MAYNINHHLENVFKTHQVKLVDSVLTQYNQERQKVAELLQKELGVGKELADNPFNSGSFKKGTAINIRFDLDLVVPFNFKVNGPKMARDQVFNLLSRNYPNQVRNQRIAVGIKIPRGSDWVEIDVVPGVEKKLGGYKGGSENPDDHYLEVYDSVGQKPITTNIRRQIDEIKKQPVELIRMMQLLKVWKKHHEINLPSYSLELFVIQAAKELKIKDYSVGYWLPIRQILDYIAKKIATVELLEVGTGSKWKDFCKEGYKDNLSARIAKMIREIEADPKKIETFFPVNPKFRHLTQ